MSIEDGPGDTLSPSEGMDSDEVRNNDGDEVVDPPEGWSGADKFGTTQREEREGESLDQRLAEEEPDVEPEEPLDRPVAATPNEELTEDLVDEVVDDDTTAADGGLKQAEVVDGVIVEDSRVDRGQIDDLDRSIRDACARVNEAPTATVAITTTHPKLNAWRNGRSDRLVRCGKLHRRTGR